MWQFSLTVTLCNVTFQNGDILCVPEIILVHVLSSFYVSLSVLVLFSRGGGGGWPGGWAWSGRGRWVARRGGWRRWTRVPRPLSGTSLIRLYTSPPPPPPPHQGCHGFYTSSVLALFSQRENQRKLKKVNNVTVNVKNHTIFYRYPQFI